MSEYCCYLITVFYASEGTLLKCALRVHQDLITDDMGLYPLDPESRKAFWHLLPPHVQTCGPVVDVEDIFEVDIADKKEVKL